MNYRPLYAFADKTFDEKEYKHYHEEIRKKENRILFDLEDAWWQENAQPLADFMGDMTLWANIIDDIDVKRGSVRGVPVMGVACARFTGSHWLSRKPGETTFFDPFKDYQVYGTNQFCQTFAMMYLVDALPKKRETKSFKNYYAYTLKALEFIRDVISSFYPDAHYFNTSLEGHYSQKDMLKKVNECIKHVNMCVNIPKA